MDSSAWLVRLYDAYFFSRGCDSYFLDSLLLMIRRANLAISKLSLAVIQKIVLAFVMDAEANVEVGLQFLGLVLVK